MDHHEPPRKRALIEPGLRALRVVRARRIATLLVGALVAVLCTLPAVPADAQRSQRSSSGRAAASGGGRVSRSRASRDRSWRTRSRYHPRSYDRRPDRRRAWSTPYDGPLAGALSVSALLAFVDQRPLVHGGRRLPPGGLSGEELGLGEATIGGVGIAGTLVLMSARIGIAADFLFDAQGWALRTEGTGLEPASQLTDSFEAAPRFFASWAPRVVGPLELIVGGYVGVRWSTFAVRARGSRYQQLEGWAATTGPELGVRLRASVLTFALAARVDLLRARSTTIELSVSIDGTPPQLARERARWDAPAADETPLPPPSDDDVAPEAPPPVEP